jgi:hypothetical protein
MKLKCAYRDSVPRGRVHYRVAKIVDRERVDDCVSTNAQTEGREFGFAQRAFLGHEELVELWWFHLRAGEHRVGLAAVMDLVLKQMEQNVADPLDLNVFCALEPNGLIETGFIPDVSHTRYESLVDGALRLRQRFERLEGVFVLEDAPATPTLEHRVDVVLVHEHDVRQRLVDTRKEARAFRAQVLQRELPAGLMKAMIGPCVVFGEAEHDG